MIAQTSMYERGPAPVQAADKEKPMVSYFFNRIVFFNHARAASKQKQDESIRVSCFILCQTATFHTIFATLMVIAAPNTPKPGIRANGEQMASKWREQMVTPILFRWRAGQMARGANGDTHSFQVAAGASATDTNFRRKTTAWSIIRRGHVVSCAITMWIAREATRRAQQWR